MYEILSPKNKKISTQLLFFSYIYLESLKKPEPRAFVLYLCDTCPHTVQVLAETRRHQNSIELKLWANLYGCWKMNLGFSARACNHYEPHHSRQIWKFLAIVLECVFYLGMTPQHSCWHAEQKALLDLSLLEPLPQTCFSLQDDQLLDDGKTLGECGFTSQTARPQAPATVGLAFRAGKMANLDSS